MGYGDYYVTLYGGDMSSGTPLNGGSGSYGNDGEGAVGQGAGNYTRVMDLYKYDNVAGYPCFDHTYGCSVDNATIGTIDAEDAEITRGLGTTLTNFNRKLDTGDTKDKVLSEELSAYYVLFAHGGDDGFHWHDDDWQTCKVDFFSGEYDCTVKSPPRDRNDQNQE
jgi:hypothetical protein